MSKWISATQPGTIIWQSVGIRWILARLAMRLQNLNVQRTAGGPSPSSGSSKFRSKDFLRTSDPELSWTGNLNSRGCPFLPAAPISFENLHKLEMGNRRSEHSPSIKQFLAFTIASPSLEVLDVSGYSSIWDDGSVQTPPPPAHLPVLKKLASGRAPLGIELNVSSPGDAGGAFDDWRLALQYRSAENWDGPSSLSQSLQGGPRAGMSQGDEYWRVSVFWADSSIGGAPRKNATTPHPPNVDQTVTEASWPSWKLGLYRPSMSTPGGSRGVDTQERGAVPLSTVSQALG
jgi:hypothetical protein